MIEPLDVYPHGSDPTNDELPPDGLFASYAPDDPDMTPMGKLLYGTSEPPPDPDEDRPVLRRDARRCSVEQSAFISYT